MQKTLEEVTEHLAKLAPGKAEVIVADDGSTDDSAAIASNFGPPVRVLRTDANRGKGDAVRRGMLAAEGDIVFFFDADLSTPLDEMAGFLDRMQAGADVVIGTRKHPDAQIERYQPWYRVQLGLAYTRLVNAVIGLRFSDYTCGFKAFRHAAAQAVFSRSLLSGWGFDAEIVFLAARLGFDVEEVPVQWADCPDSRVRVGSAIGSSFRELLAVRYHQWRGTYRLNEHRKPEA